MKNPNGNQILTESKKEEMKKDLEGLFTKMLVVLQFNPEHAQIKDTPKRMAKMYVEELFTGCYTEAPSLTSFPNVGFENQGFVFLGPLQIKSMCTHHFLPFVGSVYICYVPGKIIIGISKLSRIVKWFMRRPQIQEEFTAQLCDYLADKLQTTDIIVHCEASHSCMIIRGVEEPNPIMATTSISGTMFAKGEDRDGFFDQVTRSKL